MDVPRWFPRSEAELREALGAGALKERHFSDVKREIQLGEKANRALAVDLASFAVDGGVIVIGVDERASPAALIPVALAGEKERIDQVARSRVDPPLSVTVDELVAEDRPGEGYLVIVVPASPAAPHMVDGRYRGRSDTTNTVLSDAEVTRIRALRREALRGIHDILAAEVERDPVPEENRQLAHLFIVAQPAFADPEMLQRAVGREWRNWTTKKLLQVPRLDQEWSPDVRELVHRVHRSPDGWTATSLEPGRDPGNRGENHLLELEIREDGGLRLFSGCASDTFSRSYGHPGRKVILDVVVSGLAVRMVRAARVVSETTGYVGNWDFGLAIAGLRHTYSYQLARDFMADPLPYSADNYVQTTSATFAELTSDPDAIVERLFGRLNRTLTDGTYKAPLYR